jgi:hypothetical protein
LLVAANIVPSSLILCTLKIQAARSSETLVLTGPTRHHIPEGGILLKPYMFDIPELGVSSSL